MSAQTNQGTSAPQTENGQKPLTALDFVRMYLWQTEHHPQQGHYVNAVACKRPWNNKDDAHSRCTQCDGEALLAIPPGSTSHQEETDRG